MMESSNPVLDKVRRALGRTHPLTTPPVPPVIDEPITRLVHSEIGLPELFAKMAEANKMHVEIVSVDDLIDKVSAFLKSKGVKSVALPFSTLFEKLNISRALSIAGFVVSRWDQMSRDSVYDVDCGLTDVTFAIAETGSLVIVPSPGHGRSLSLVPPLHVAIVEPKNFLPDLVDLFTKLPPDGSVGVTIITGPSKTADIEGALVVGVHGPGEVQVFVLQ